MILYSDEGLIPVHVRASFAIPSPKDIDRQLKPSQGSKEDVKVLIWILLGNLEETRRKRHQFSDRVVFFNGSGICNGMSLDMLRAVKRLHASE